MGLVSASESREKLHFHRHPACRVGFVFLPKLMPCEGDFGPHNPQSFSPKTQLFGKSSVPDSISSCTTIKALSSVPLRGLARSGKVGLRVLMITTRRDAPCASSPADRIGPAGSPTSPSGDTWNSLTYINNSHGPSKITSWQLTCCRYGKTPRRLRSRRKLNVIILN